MRALAAIDSADQFAFGLQAEKRVDVAPFGRISGRNATFLLVNEAPQFVDLDALDVQVLQFPVDDFLAVVADALEQSADRVAMRSGDSLDTSDAASFNKQTDDLGLFLAFQVICHDSRSLALGAIEPYTESGGLCGSIARFLPRSRFQPRTGHLLKKGGPPRLTDLGQRSSVRLKVMARLIDGRIPQPGFNLFYSCHAPLEKHQSSRPLVYHDSKRYARVKTVILLLDSVAAMVYYISEGS